MNLNKNRFPSDMEAARELWPQTDGTPESRSHARRFTPPGQGPQAPKPERKERTPKDEDRL